MIAPQLAVTDLDASVTFYTEKLGFETMFILQGEDGANSFAWLTFGEGVQIGLSAEPAPAPAGNGVVFMIYPSKEVELDKLYHDVQSRGVAIEQPLRDEYWGDRTFAVKDPDGYYLLFARTVKDVSVADLANIMKQDSTQT